MCCSSGDLSFQTSCLVSPQIDELILGLAFLRERCAKWNFQTGELWIDGYRLMVQEQPSPPKCRRVALAQDVSVPALCEMDIDAYAILPNLCAPASQFATKTKVLETGLIVAGTLLPERTLDLTVRVMNPTKRTIRLRKGIHCELDEVRVAEREITDQCISDCAAIKPVSPEEVETALSPLWNNVAEDVPRR